MPRLYVSPLHGYSQLTTFVLNFGDCTWIIQQHHNLLEYITELLGRLNESSQNTGGREFRISVVAYGKVVGSDACGLTPKIIGWKTGGKKRVPKAREWSNVEVRMPENVRWSVFKALRKLSFLHIEKCRTFRDCRWAVWHLTHRHEIMRLITERNRIKSLAALIGWLLRLVADIIHCVSCQVTETLTAFVTTQSFH